MELTQPAQAPCPWQHTRAPAQAQLELLQGSKVGQSPALSPLRCHTLSTWAGGMGRAESPVGRQQEGESWTSGDRQALPRHETPSEMGTRGKGAGALDKQMEEPDYGFSADGGKSACKEGQFL